MGKIKSKFDSVAIFIAIDESIQILHDSIQTVHDSTLIRFRGLQATYDDHLYRLIGKRVVDFLLVLIEPFSLGVTAEALRAIIGSKSAISLQRLPVDPKFQVERVTPPTILLLRKLGLMIFRIWYKNPDSK